MKKLITQSEFSRLAGCTPQAVHNLIGKRLKDAMHGHRIDPSHPIAVAYLRERATVKSLQRKPAACRGISATVLAEILRVCPTARGGAQMGLIAGLSVQQVVEVLPLNKGVADHVRILRRIEEVAMIQLKIDEKESELAPREMVAFQICSMLDDLTQRADKSMPSAIAARAFALASNGAPLEDVEAMARLIVTQHLKGYAGSAKSNMLDRYRNAESEDDPELAEVKRLFPRVRAPGEIRAIADLTVSEVADQFGDAAGACEYISIVKKIADTRMMSLKLAEKEGELVRRDWVRAFIFGQIESLHQRLLRDAPRTIASRVYASAKSGATQGEAEDLIRGILIQHLRSCSVPVRRLLAQKSAPIEAAQA